MGRPRHDVQILTIDGNVVSEHEDLPARNFVWLAPGVLQVTVPMTIEEFERIFKGCAACDGDPEAHGLHVCGKEPHG